MFKSISDYTYSLLKNTLVSSSYEETLSDDTKREIEKVYSYSLRSGNAEYLCSDVHQNVNYDNIKPEDIPLDIIREMTIGESPVAYPIVDDKDTVIETLKFNNKEFNVMAAAELNSKYISYDKYKKCDDNKYIFKCQDKPDYKPGVLVNSLGDNNLYKGKLYYIYDEDDPQPGLNWIDLEFDNIDTPYYKNPFAIISSKNSLDHSKIIYKRDKFGFVEECKGEEYYCAKYTDTYTDNKYMTIRTIYPVQFILTLDGLLIAKDNHLFEITELADIDLENNIVTYTKRSVTYTEKSFYLDLIKESKELDKKEK